MSSKIIFTIIFSGLLSFNQIFAASGDINESTSVDSGANVLTTEAVGSSAPALGANNVIDPTIVSYKGKVGDYPEIPCDNIDYFTQHSCNQCFNGDKKTVGERLTGFSDSWTNLNSTDQIVYKDEQIFPEFVNLGGNNTKWTIVPESSNQFWKFASEIIWTTSGSGQDAKEEFILEGNKTINFIEADFGASYTLASTDKNEGDPIGLLKFYSAYHDIDNSGIESVKKVNTECVAYYSATPAPITPLQPVPVETVQVKTGPEIYFLVLLALILGFVFIKVRKNKSI